MSRINGRIRCNITPFEKNIEGSFDEYLTSHTAFLHFLFPKMRMAGYLDKSPGFIQVAKSPYDVAGYFIGSGQYIACEIKENGEHHHSMTIIPPGKKGTGLQYHQLEALVRAHNSGAFACVMWDNAGDIGILNGSRLVAAKAAMDTSLKAEKAGYPDAARGARSVLWGNFERVKQNSLGVPLWLPSK